MHTLCRWPGRPLDTVICGQKERQSQIPVNLRPCDLTIALLVHGAPPTQIPCLSFCLLTQNILDITFLPQTSKECPSTFHPMSVSAW